MFRNRTHHSLFSLVNSARTIFNQGGMVDPSIIIAIALLLVVTLYSAYNGSRTISGVKIADSVGFGQKGDDLLNRVQFVLNSINDCSLPVGSNGNLGGILLPTPTTSRTVELHYPAPAVSSATKALTRDLAKVGMQLDGVKIKGMELAYLRAINIEGTGNISSVLGEIRITVENVESSNRKRLAIPIYLVPDPNNLQRVATCFATQLGSDGRTIEDVACRRITPSPQNFTTIIFNPWNQTCYRRT